MLHFVLQNINSILTSMFIQNCTTKKAYTKISFPKYLQILVYKNKLNMVNIF